MEYSIQAANCTSRAIIAICMSTRQELDTWTMSTYFVIAMCHNCHDSDLHAKRNALTWSSPDMVINPALTWSVKAMDSHPCSEVSPLLIDCTFILTKGAFHHPPFKTSTPPTSIQSVLINELSQSSLQGLTRANIHYAHNIHTTHQHLSRAHQW